MLTWGASPDDMRKRLPGDDLTADDPIQSTNVVTIDARRVRKLRRPRIRG
jgi:hypothetical protein